MSRKIVYIAPGRASFVMQDIAWLQKEVEVQPYFFKTKSKLLVPLEMLKLLLFLLFSKSKSYLVSFGGYHSLVATIVARWKNIACHIILNGTDSANIPEYNYGHLRRGILRKVCLLSYEKATSLLPVSSSLIQTTNQYAFDQPKHLGIKNEFPDLNTDMHVIPNGFDTEFWKDSDNNKEANSFVTVVGSTNRVVHKGLDLILKVATHFAESKFYVVGLDRLEGAPSNMIFLGYLDKIALREVYQKVEYYFQLSIWEGFGCALCEAMLCGCHPIVSNVNILPDIVGEAGLVLDKRSDERLNEVMKNELSKSEFNDPTEQIKRSFSIERRMQMLSDVLSK